MYVMPKQLIKYLMIALTLALLNISDLVSHGIRIGGNLQMGDNVAEYSLARILSLKYNIPLYHNGFTHSDLFVFDVNRNVCDDTLFDKVVKVYTEKDIRDHIKSKQNVLFWTTVRTRIDDIKPQWVEQLKRDLQLKETPDVSLPQDIIKVAVHIRKGNGGGQIYDGVQASLQQFDFDRSRVKYLTDYNNFAFDWDEYRRNHAGILVYAGKTRVYVDKIRPYMTKFPPDQFYIDQIIKLSNDLHDAPLFVQILTDDKEPLVLLNRLKQVVNKSNITFYYHDTIKLSYKERMAHDLYIMSQCEVLIRSQSYFSRTAEQMGKNKVVIYPLSANWDHEKLVMNKVVIKGNIKNLLT